MQREIARLIEPAADNMAARLIGRYPRGRKEHPGRKHMRDDIRVRKGRADLAYVVVGARIGPIWQDGTVRRRDGTRKYANRGRMPAASPHLFENTAVAVRAQMLERAQQILDRPHEI